MEEVVMTDHDFAAWLRRHGWDKTYHHTANATMYHGAGKIINIAMTLCDNEKSTRRIFINEEA